MLLRSLTKSHNLVTLLTDDDVAGKSMPKVKTCFSQIRPVMYKTFHFGCSLSCNVSRYCCQWADCKVKLYIKLVLNFVGDYWSFLLKIESPVNTHQRGKNHCSTGIQFEWFGLSRFSVYK